MNEAMARLKAAVKNPEQRKESFDKWLAKECQFDGIDPADLDAAEVLSKRREFDFNLLAEVSPLDVLEVCRFVEKPSQTVLDLKLGSSRAKKTKADGSPNTVHILMRDLEHLLGQVVKPTG